MTEIYVFPLGFCVLYVIQLENVDVALGIKVFPNGTTVVGIH